MNPDTPADARPHIGQPELSAAALHEWNAHVEAVLRGVAHALNNRAAALSALIQLADDSEPGETLRGILASELDRVSGLGAALRSIGTPRPGEEAFAPSDAVSEAVGVLALHSEQRDTTTRIDVLDAPPLRVHRWMFIRALVALAANSGRANPDARLTVTSGGDDLVVRVENATPAESPLVRELARAMGGDALEEGRGFRLPTLASLRRRAGS